MVTIRRKLLAIAVMTAFVFGAGATPVAASANQRRCAAQNHHCGTTDSVVSCCCGHQHDASQPATADTHAQNVAAPASSLSGASAPAVVPAVLHAREHSSPVRGSPPDFQTLYATFLI